MLPSKGYFKALECPYHTESYCKRPYCHFKHSKQELLSDLECQVAAKTENIVSSSDKSNFSEEPKLKQKVKSKIIEYVPQCVKPKNSELVDSLCIYGSTNKVGNNETSVPEYIPSSVNDLNLNFEIENFKGNNVSNDKEQMQTINYTDGLSMTYNIGEQKASIAEYVPTVIEKSKVSKIEKHDDKNHCEQRSLSKRKHESSKSSSKSSSKKSKRGKSPEFKKHKKEQLNEEKSEKNHSKEQNNKCKNLKSLTSSATSSGSKSLKAVVMEKLQKKLKVEHSNDVLSTESIESDLVEFSNSEDSSSEQNDQKQCIVEAKVKKRIAHISTSSIFAKINAGSMRPKSSKSLHELVADRVKSIHNNINLSSFPIKSTIKLNNDPTLPMLKIKNRVAHQPKIELNNTVCQTSSSSKVINKEMTTDVKLNLRVKTFKSSNNMPNPMRQSCLEKLYVAFVNHYSSEEAIEKAHTTEEEVHIKAKSSGIYRNLIVQSLLKANKSPELQIKSNPNYPSHMYGVCLYGLLKKYILSKEDLENNGYPLMGDNKLAYISKKAYYYQPLSKKRNGKKFICMNCRSEFEVDKQGMPTITLTKCIYHSGKLKFERSKNEKFWLCCYRRQHESGCESSIYHIPDKLDEDALENFVETKSIKSNKNDDEPNFFALDCEMVNTTVGIEIVRVTVINHEGEEVYESKVKPINPILDYKSKFSGINEESLRHCSKRLCEVQLDLLKKFDKDSILIGHSLESDLKALKMVHHNIVDTSVMYPHKYGPPYKWALKLLAEQHLQRIIQSEEGHDSKEDAVASLDLVWKKLKDDVKKFKPISIISLGKK